MVNILKRILNRKSNDLNIPFVGNLVQESSNEITIGIEIGKKKPFSISSTQNIAIAGPTGSGATVAGWIIANAFVDSGAGKAYVLSKDLKAARSALRESIEVIDISTFGLMNNPADLLAAHIDKVIYESKDKRVIIFFDSAMSLLWEAEVSSGLKDKMKQMLNNPNCVVVTRSQFFHQDESKGVAFDRNNYPTKILMGKYSNSKYIDMFGEDTPMVMTPDFIDKYNIQETGIELSSVGIASIQKDSSGHIALVSMKQRSLA